MKKSTFERVVPAILASFWVRFPATRRSGSSFILVAGEQQKRSREPLLVVREQLPEQVFLDTDVRAEHVGDEAIRHTPASCEAAEASFPF